MARKSKRAADPWEQDDFLSPNPAAPVVKQKKGNRWLYWWVMSAAFLMPLMVLVNAVLINDILIAAPASTGSYESSSRPVATAALNSWLAQKPAPIPAAQVLSWQGVTQLPPGPAKEGAQEEPALVEVHRFAILSGTAMFDVEVTTTTVAGITQPFGAPAISSGMPLTTPLDEAPIWGEFVAGAVTDEIEEAVRTWSQALLSGDGTKLRQAVGDRSLTNTYLPLHGAKWMDSKVGAITTLTPASSVDDPDFSVLVASVTISYVAGDQVVESNQVPSNARFDVRIEAADTASPVVTAWGASGAGPGLVAYGNAVTLGEVKLATPEPAPGESTTPTSSPPGTPATSPTPSPTTTTSAANQSEEP